MYFDSHLKIWFRGAFLLEVKKQPTKYHRYQTALNQLKWSRKLAEPKPIV